MIFIILSTCLGLFALFKVKGNTMEYYIAGRKLNWVMISVSCLMTCFDSGMAVGSLDYGYMYHCARCCCGAPRSLREAFRSVVQIHALSPLRPRHPMR